MNQPARIYAREFIRNIDGSSLDQNSNQGGLAGKTASWEKNRAVPPPDYAGMQKHILARVLCDCVLEVGFDEIERCLTVTLSCQGARSEIGSI